MAPNVTMTEGREEAFPSYTAPRSPTASGALLPQMGLQVPILPKRGPGVKMEAATMDSATVREHLRELNERLADLDQEREVVRNLIVGYEGWLRLSDRPPEPKAPGAAKGKPEKARSPRSSAVKGKISLSQAVLRVVKEAHGQPLHGREIASRVQAMGAQTTSARPERGMELLLYSHRNRGQRELERVAPLTWRWTGE
jgi:hypothetical protein